MKDLKGTFIQVTFVAGCIFEIVLALLAVYKIWHLVCLAFEWLCTNIPEDAMPFIFLMIFAFAAGIVYYDHTHCVEADWTDDEEDDEDE